MGPRQTGKTTYLSEQIKFDKAYNLLHADVYARLLQDPSFLRRSLKNSEKMILIDEIQKLPLLMDEVHALIEEKKIKFVLTGSGARKLCRTHTSLAGGRLRVRYMFPFVSEEVPNYSLNKVLQYGLIPPIYLSEEPEKD